MNTFIDHFEYHTLNDNFNKNGIATTIISFGKLHSHQRTKEMSEDENDRFCHAFEPDFEELLSQKTETNEVNIKEECGGNTDANEINTQSTDVYGTKTKLCKISEVVNNESFKEKELVCGYCKLCFESKANLSDHIITKHLNQSKKGEKKEKSGKVLICKFCSGLLQPKQLKSHMAKCRALFLAGRSILCHLCGKSLDHASLKGHMYMHRELNKGHQTCLECGKVFRTARSLRSHRMLHDESRKLICEICGVKTHPYSLWKHVKKHKLKEQQCKLCGKAFTFNYMLRAHMKTHALNSHHSKVRPLVHSTTTHKCPKCEKEYTYVSMLNAHLKEEHDDASMEIEPVFGCRFCDKSFDDQYSLRNHLLLIHEASKEDLLELKPGMQLGVFHCTLCEAVLQSEFGLRLHLKSIHGLQNKEMPQQMRRNCEKCDRSFSNKAGLTAHIKSVHLNIMTLSCELCGKTFKRHQGLINHKLIHLGKKPFECEVCLRTFRQRSDVIRHLQRHVRDGEATVDNATARNNSESTKLRKSRIFLKDSSYSSITN